MNNLITDHALLRYIERVHGVDVERLKAQILNDFVRSAIKGGANVIKTKECTFMVEHGRIVTTLTHGMSAIPKQYKVGS
jgi:hypothetical protein